MERKKIAILRWFWQYGVLKMSNEDSDTPDVSRGIRCLYPRRVNSEFLAFLPTSRYEGRTVLVETDEVLDSELPEIMSEKILGFDTETRPNFQKGKQYPVSILQLGGSMSVWVIRLKPLLHRLGDIFKVLENPSIKKVGIAVKGDIKGLRSLCDFKPSGFVDVSDITSKMGVVNTGMRNLAALILGEKISKRDQCSNWANERLSDSQIKYAATDAWMSRRLYLEMLDVVAENRTDVEPEPEPEPERFDLRKFILKVVRAIKKSVKSLGPSPKKPCYGNGRKRGARSKRSKNS